MPAAIIDGEALAAKILESVKERVSAFRELNGFAPCLAVVLAGSNPASELYVEKKQQACKNAGIESLLVKLPETVSEKELLEKIHGLNEDNKVNAILIQLPLPKQTNQEKILNAVAPEKDADGFNAENLGRLAQGSEEVAPCTPKAIIKAIESTGAKLEGADVVIVNHSVVIGKPLALMLLNRNATVTVCHKFSKNLAEKTKQADILIVGAGKPGLINREMVKPGAVVIDAGISRNGKKVIGDIDFDSAKKVAGFLTPVPGGIGPLTVACLLENTIELAERQVKKDF